ncbi:MAG: SprT-like domain-containing protein [Elusimicrobia bacterium]|nr:SprT-like domain-containing protein [Elusimicrobiota bacterium]
MRPIIVVLLVLTLVVAYLSTLGEKSGGSQRVPETPVTPEEKLIARASQKPGDPELGAAYKDINARHFGGRLPEIPVLWEPGLDGLGEPASKGFRMDGLWGHYGSRTLILLNPRLQGDREALRRVLCHEMVHQHLHAVGDSKTKHGQAFQKTLRRLSDEGAFTGIAAVEGEKKALQSWLDAKESQLSRIESLLAAQRVGVEVAEAGMADLNARIEAANAQGHGWPSAPEMRAVESTRNERVAAYNSLMRGYNADIDVFNDEARRYNLMTAYPDGLDEEALVQPRVAAVPPSAGEGR